MRRFLLFITQRQIYGQLKIITSQIMFIVLQRLLYFEVNSLGEDVETIKN